MHILFLSISYFSRATTALLSIVDTSTTTILLLYYLLLTVLHVHTTTQQTDNSYARVCSTVLFGVEPIKKHY